MKFIDYVVETDGLSADDRAGVCRSTLQALHATVTQLETDVPWSNHTSWPETARAAAHALITATGRPVDTEAYQATGMMQRTDDAVWEAFEIFAGYAFDASAWSENRLHAIVSLSDEGTSVVVHIEDEERRRLEEAVRPVPVVPLRQARAARRHRR